MPAVVARAIIDREDMENLREAFVHRNGMMNLLNEKANPTERDYEMFARKDDQYNRCWDSVLNRYFDGEYKRGDYLWNCDFDTCEVTITG